MLNAFDSQKWEYTKGLMSYIKFKVDERNAHIKRSALHETYCRYHTKKLTFDFDECNPYREILTNPEILIIGEECTQCGKIDNVILTGLPCDAISTPHDKKLNTDPIYTKNHVMINTLLAKHPEDYLFTTLKMFRILTGEESPYFGTTYEFWVTTVCNRCHRIIYKQTHFFGFFTNDEEIKHRIYQIFIHYCDKMKPIPTHINTSFGELKKKGVRRACNYDLIAPTGENIVNYIHDKIKKVMLSNPEISIYGLVTYCARNGIESLRQSLDHMDDTIDSLARM